MAFTGFFVSASRCSRPQYEGLRCVKLHGTVSAQLLVCRLARVKVDGRASKSLLPSGALLSFSGVRVPV